MQNNYIYFKSLLIIITFILAGCTDKKLDLQGIDPYEESFLGKGIHKVIAYNPLYPRLNDTIILNRQGQVMEFKGTWDFYLNFYNEGAQLIRYYSPGNNNYLIKYKSEDNIIAQEFYRIYHNRIKYSSQDDIRLEFTNYYVFDNEGRISECLKEFNNKLVYKEIFEYENEHLINKTTWRITEYPDLLRTYNYEYGENNTISRITIINRPDSSIHKIHYFNNEGLLDSTYEQDFKKYYKYICYED